MKNEAIMDYESVQMLFLLANFKNKSQEIKSLQKLFLLMAILKYPFLFKETLNKIINNEFQIERYFNNNVEIEATKQKKYINLDIFFIPLGRLVSKSLVEIINHKNHKQIKITETGLKLLEKLDDYEWYNTKVLSSIIKTFYGDKSFSSLFEEFNSIITMLSGEKY